MKNKIKNTLKFTNVDNYTLDTDVFQNVEILFRNGKLLVGFRDYDEWKYFCELTGVRNFYYQNDIMFSFCHYSENREEDEIRSIVSINPKIE